MELTVTLDIEDWKTLLSAADCGMLDLDPEYHRTLEKAMDHIESGINLKKIGE